MPVRTHGPPPRRGPGHPHGPASPSLRRTGAWLALALALGLPSPGPGRCGEPGHSTPARLASRSLLLDVSAAGGLVAAVGERGHILLSRDQGQTWQQAQVPTQSTLTAVHLHDGERGWAVGHDGVIVRTRDGGRSWERVRWAPEEESPLLDVWFRDALSGYAIGAYGLFLETEDGGGTWTPRAVSEEEWHLNHLARSESGRLYIAAEAGSLYRSDDGGHTWASLPSPYEGSFFGSLPLDGDEVLLFGLRGHVFRSEDAGESWEPVPSGTEESVTTGVVLPDGRALLGGLGGTVLVSDSDRRALDLRQQEDRKGISGLANVPGGVVAVGEFGVRMLEY